MVDVTFGVGHSRLPYVELAIAPAVPSEFVALVHGAPLPVGLSARFSFIIGGLCSVLADTMSRERTTIPLLHLVWTTLRRRADRFARLVARFEAGTLSILRAPRPRKAAPPASDPAPRADRPQVRLARGEALRLVRAIYGTGVYDALLRQMLEEPQMAKLLAAAPQAGRLVRPVLQMLSPHPLPAILDIAPRGRNPAPASRPPLARAPSCVRPGWLGLGSSDVVGASLRVPRSRFGPHIWT